MEGTRVKHHSGAKDEIQMRRHSSHSSRASPSLQKSPSITSNDDLDLQLFKWAHTNDVRRRSSDAAGHKWIIENMKDGTQSDDEDPLGLLQEDYDEDDDDSPSSSRPDSKSPQILFPPDSLWEEARRDSFFEKARRDSIRWVEENKKEILREMGIDSIPDIPDGIDSVPDTPVLKRNSYMEKAADVQVVVTSYDDNPLGDNISDEEEAEPPRSWIASAIRRLSQSVITEPVEKDLSELQNQGQVALEVREIETKRRGSQSLSSDVEKIMADWEKEHKERRASCIEQNNIDKEYDNSTSFDLERHKGSHDNERRLSGSRKNSSSDGKISSEKMRRGSKTSNGSLRKSISNIDDSEVKVIITSPDDENEIIETKGNWITNTIRRLSNASSIDDSHTDDRRSSNENISHSKDLNINEEHNNSSEGIDNSQKVSNNHGMDEQNSVYEDGETPKGWLATAIRRLSSVGNVNDSVQDEPEETEINSRRASKGSSRRSSHKDEEKEQSKGKLSNESSRRGSYKSDYSKDHNKEKTEDSNSEDNGYDFKDSPTDEKPTEWLASAIRRLSSVPTEEDSIIPKESSVYKREESNNNESRRKSTENNLNIDDKRTSSESRRYSYGSYKQQSNITSRSESRNSLNTDEQAEEQNILSPEVTPTGWLVNAVRRLSSISNEDIINENRSSIDRRSSNQSSYRNEREEGSRGASRTSYHSDFQDENKESGDSLKTVKQDLNSALSIERRRSSQGSNKSESREISRSASRKSFHDDQQDENDESNNILSQEDTPTGWLVNAVRRLSSAPPAEVLDNEEMSPPHEEEHLQKTSRNSSENSAYDGHESQNMLSPEDTPSGWLASTIRRLSSVSDESNINVVEKRSSTDITASNSEIYNTHESERSRNASKSSIHDEQQNLEKNLSHDNTPTGWLVNAVRRLSSATPEGSNTNDMPTLVQEAHYQKTSRSASKSSIHNEESKSILSPEDTPTGWLAGAVRRLSSVSNENNINMEEKRQSTGSAYNDPEMFTSKKSQRSRNASRGSVYEIEQDLKENLSPEDTPKGWLENTVRKLSSASIEKDTGIDESKVSTDNTQNLSRRSSLGSHRSRSASRERRISTGSINNESEMYFNQRAHRSINASGNSLNKEEQDFKENLSPEDTPTGWLANTIRRLSTASNEKDIETEERKLSIDNTHNHRRRSSQGSQRSRSASRNSLHYDEQNEFKNTSKSASRNSFNYDEQKESINILSPEDTPTGWLANAVRRLSSVSGEDMKKRPTNPSNIPTPPAPCASSEDEDVDEKSIFSSTGRRLSSNSRESDNTTNEELENKVKSSSADETHHLQSNPTWVNSAIRRLSMREEETIELPHEIHKNISKINQQNIVKPVADLDSNEDDYTPVLISKKKIGKGMAWQNGFDWHSLQGPPDVTFCGCGFLGIYMVGVAEVLLDHRPDLLKGRIGGSSVGSLVAACLVTGVPLQKLRQELLHVADLAQAYTLGPLNPWFALEEPLLQGLLQMMPQDAHTKASGRLFLSLTRLSNMSNEVVSEYPTRDELIRAILCCCWLPGISSFTAPTFMGKSYIDGAFSAVNPWHGLSNNLSVSAYAGNFGICPDDSDLYPYQPQISALGVAYNMQPMNGNRAIDALMPPPGDILDKYYHNGVFDTHIFLTTLK